MLNLEEQYENLYDFIKAKVFNITLDDLKSLNSFNELLMRTPNTSKSYLISQVENFYTDIIEPSKDELY